MSDPAEQSSDRNEIFARLRAENEALRLSGSGDPVAAAASGEPSATRRAAMTIPLDYPLMMGTETVDAISLCPPTVGDVEDVTEGRISEIEMHARMADMSVAAMRALRWSDAEKVLVAARLLAPEIRRA